MSSREHSLFVECSETRRCDAETDPACAIAATDAILRYRAWPTTNSSVKRLVSPRDRKIHTTEWTTQLLYDEPLYLGMNANWHGLFRGHALLEAVLEKITVRNFGKSSARLAVVDFPGSYASLKEKPYIQEMIRDLLDTKKPTDQERP
jgi:hypothetical protein